jgi:hypothetical protein
MIYLTGIICLWFLRKFAENSAFPPLTLFNVKVRSSRDGKFNVHNQYAEADKNPHGILHSSHLGQFSLNK